MKKLILKLVIFSSPIFILLVATNYFGDAAKIFQDGYERKIAEIIIDGKSATNISNYDERIFQEELISKLNYRPAIVVIGSSRTMLISSEHSHDGRLINNSVSGASIEDAIAIYQIYKENQVVPQKIILGIDPWTFNDNSGQNRWESIKSYYQKFKNILDNKASYKSKYIELLSLSYFQSSLKALLTFSKDYEPKPTSKTHNITNTKLADGSLVYGKEFREASEEVIMNKITSYISEEVYSIENFTSISEKKWSDFNMLLSELKQHQVEVEFFLSPYHPVVYEKIKNEYPMVLETEIVILDYAYENSIKLYGSFDPHKLGVDGAHFYDAMHCREECIDLILATEKG